MRPTLAVLAALLACTACTIGETVPTSTAPQVSTPATPASAAPSAAATPATQTLAKRETSFGRASARIEVNELVVADGVTTLTWTLVNTASADLTMSSSLGSSIVADGVAANVPGSDEPVPGDGGASDGVYLIDSANQRRYLPARDSAGVCACTALGRGELLGPGLSRVFSATFAAIPEGTTTVGVAIPGVGTFPAVPVQR